MSTKQTTGYTQSSDYSSLENQSFVPYESDTNDTTFTSTLLVLALLAGLVYVEHNILHNVVVHVTPIEQKYSFNSLDECTEKLKTLNTTQTQLRCIPNANNDSSTAMPSTKRIQ